MKHAVAILTLAIAGCAVTPSEIRDAGSRFEFQSANAPERAARCIARNGEEQWREWFSDVRPLEKPGGWEIIFRLGHHGVFVLGEAMPAETGSSVVVWIRPYLIYDHAAVARDLMKGC